MGRKLSGLQCRQNSLVKDLSRGDNRESNRGRFLMSFYSLPVSVHGCIHLHIHIHVPHMPHSYTQKEKGERKKGRGD